MNTETIYKLKLNSNSKYFIKVSPFVINHIYKTSSVQLTITTASLYVEIWMTIFYYLIRYGYIKCDIIDKKYIYIKSSKLFVD